MPKRILGSRNLAIFERWVTFYSIRVMPILWIAGISVGMLSQFLLSEDAVKAHVFSVATDSALLAMATWFLLTGAGSVWLIARSFFHSQAERGPMIDFLRIVALLTGVSFLIFGWIMVRGVGPRYIRELFQ